MCSISPTYKGSFFMEALVRKRSRDATKPDTELLLQLDLHKLHFMMIPTKESGGMSASTTPTKPPSNTRKNSGLLGNAMMMMIDSPTKSSSSSKRKVIRLEEITSINPMDDGQDGFVIILRKFPNSPVHLVCREKTALNSFLDALSAVFSTSAASFLYVKPQSQQNRPQSQQGRAKSNSKNHADATNQISNMISSSTNEDGDFEVTRNRMNSTTEATRKWSSKQSSRKPSCNNSIYQDTIIHHNHHAHSLNATTTTNLSHEKEDLRASSALNRSRIDQQQHAQQQQQQEQLSQNTTANQQRRLHSKSFDRRPSTRTLQPIIVEPAALASLAANESTSQTLQANRPISRGRFSRSSQSKSIRISPEKYGFSSMNSTINNNNNNNNGSSNSRAAQPYSSIPPTPTTNAEGVIIVKRQSSTGRRRSTNESFDRTQPIQHNSHTNNEVAGTSEEARTTLQHRMDYYKQRNNQSTSVGRKSISSSPKAKNLTGNNTLNTSQHINLQQQQHQNQVKNNSNNNNNNHQNKPTLMQSASSSSDKRTSLTTKPRKQSIPSSLMEDIDIHTLDQFSTHETTLLHNTEKYQQQQITPISHSSIPRKVLKPIDLQEQQQASTTTAMSGTGKPSTINSLAAAAATGGGGTQASMSSSQKLMNESDSRQLCSSMMNYNNNHVIKAQAMQQNNLGRRRSILSREATKEGSLISGGAAAVLLNGEAHSNGVTPSQHQSSQVHSSIGKTMRSQMRSRYKHEILLLSGEISSLAYIDPMNKGEGSRSIYEEDTGSHSELVVDDRSSISSTIHSAVAVAAAASATPVAAGVSNMTQQLQPSSTTSGGSERRNNSMNAHSRKYKHSKDGIAFPKSSHKEQSMRSFYENEAIVSSAAAYNRITDTSNSSSNQLAKKECLRQLYGEIESSDSSPLKIPIQSTNSLLDELEREGVIGNSQMMENANSGLLKHVIGAETQITEQTYQNYGDSEVVLGKFIEDLQKNEADHREQYDPELSTLKRRLFEQQQQQPLATAGIEVRHQPKLIGDDDFVMLTNEDVQPENSIIDKIDANPVNKDSNQIIPFHEGMFYKKAVSIDGVEEGDAGNKNGSSLKQQLQLQQQELDKSTLPVRIPSSTHAVATVIADSNEVSSNTSKIMKKNNQSSVGVELKGGQYPQQKTSRSGSLNSHQLTMRLSQQGSLAALLPTEENQLNKQTSFSKEEKNSSAVIITPSREVAQRKSEVIESPRTQKSKEIKVAQPQYDTLQVPSGSTTTQAAPAQGVAGVYFHEFDNSFDNEGFMQSINKFDEIINLVQANQASIPPSNQANFSKKQPANTLNDNLYSWGEQKEQKQLSSDDDEYEYEYEEVTDYESDAEDGIEVAEEEREIKNIEKKIQILEQQQQQLSPSNQKQTQNEGSDSNAPNYDWDEFQKEETAGKYSIGLRQQLFAAIVTENVVTTTATNKANKENEEKKKADLLAAPLMISSSASKPIGGQTSNSKVPPSKRKRDVFTDVYWDPVRFPKNYKVDTQPPNLNEVQQSVGVAVAASVEPEQKTFVEKESAIEEAKPELKGTKKKKKKKKKKNVKGDSSGSDFVRGKESSNSAPYNMFTDHRHGELFKEVDDFKSWNSKKPTNYSSNNNNNNQVDLIQDSQITKEVRNVGGQHSAIKEVHLMKYEKQQQMQQQVQKKVEQINNYDDWDEENSQLFVKS